MQESIGFLLDDTARLFRRAFDARARDMGVTALQYRLLRYLADHPRARQSRLAERLEIAPITLSRMIKRLKAAGLATHSGDPHDRRVKCLDATPRALRLLSDAFTIASATAQDATEGISAQEGDELAALLSRIREKLSRFVDP